MTTVIKTITLDLDDTLWPIDAVMTRAEAILHAWLERQAPAVAAALPPAAFALYRRDLALERPELTHDFTRLRREALRRALERYGEDVGLAEAALDVFLTARNEVEFYPDVPEALQRLSRRFAVVSLSNGNADLERIGIGRFFTAMVSSRGAGFAKPDARIFHLACERAGSRPDEVLHVGDDPDLDVRGALGAGLRTVWVNRDRKAWIGAAVETHEVHDLLALCEWLGA